MDPIACWTRVRLALDDGDTRAALDGLRDLHRWYESGGFRPAVIPDPSMVAATVRVLALALGE